MLTQHLPDALLTPGSALHPLTTYRQFVLFKLRPKQSGPGKFDKLPVHPDTLSTHDAHDPAIWLSADQAVVTAMQKGSGYGIGFVLTAADPFWFLDLDSCLGPGNQWSAVAHELCKRLDGAAVEVSQSGRGLHIIGKATSIPAHGCKNLSHGLEFYHEGRFIALTGTGAVGDAGRDLTASLPPVIQDYFPPSSGGELTRPAEWTTTARPGYGGPADDDELIAKACASRGDLAGQTFGNKASFNDLWTANEAALSRAYPDNYGSRPYDASSADAALAAHLAFWTGSNCERIERILRRSALVREKWNKHSSYLHRTITAALARCDRIYGQPEQIAQGITLPFQASAETFGLLSSRSAKLIRFNGCWFTRAAGGYYRQIEEEIIRSEIRTSCPWQLSPTKVNATVDELKSAVVVDAHGVELPYWMEDVKEMPQASDLIVCRNGILDPSARRLYPHTDTLLTFNALPFDYSADAPSPTRWLRFLGEVFGDDLESVRELQKLAGYLLTLDTSQQKIFAIIGPKRSGKGTIARVLRALIGSDNVCSPSFNSIGGDFGLASLIGKQLAIFPDARIGKRTDRAVVAERLLSISGEDALDINRKHRDEWHGKLHTRLLILSNEVPVFGDASGALASRYVVFHTPHSFLGREDRTLTDKLLEELPGILNWALDGLHQLRRDGVIVTPASAAELVDEIDSLGSPVKAFVRECCIVGEPSATESDVTKDQLWFAYRRWHQDNGINGSPLSKEIFSRNLKIAFPGRFSDYRPPASTDDKRRRRWKGVRLSDELPEPTGAMVTGSRNLAASAFGAL